MWHFSAVPTAPSNVGYRGQTGRHTLMRVLRILTQLGHSANNFAVMHNSVLTQQCGNVRPLA